ncbi:MBL fold metallo-hydrolase [Dactylosporangium sp. AC04546]|uniref:MBL fold metallo-hydrolase n=1 Tax=Dactylosporangium sp. AC04546 TaxID=2862460 RepID=UPI001EE07E7F|nr:MBL fold metallo-hydrolase [Dactylosporangium sp. AC04546]WVK79412.1 MBL fold metallo-hydrolase [Dactylosporangium sp. AC04546]
MIDRRNVMKAAVAGAAAAAVPAVSPAAAAPAKAPVKATFRWFGTTGWRLDAAGQTLLVDPYLSRFTTGLFAGAFNAATQITVDAEAIATRVGRPETVLVTHTHWDHFADVPHIARTTGARVVGTLTAYHLALAAGVPSGQLSPVKGGELFDFGAYSVEIVASLHSRNAAYSMAFPGVRLATPPAPATIADLPEGDTLAYQVTVAGGPKVFFMGGSDFVERNLSGLEPDVAMVAMPSSGSTKDYVPRLLEALGRPKVVVPVHWDNFETPLRNPPPVAPADKPRLETMLAAIRSASPRSTVLLPAYDTPYTF